MCGILGIFKRENTKELLEEGMEIISYRGTQGKGYGDGTNSYFEECPKNENLIGHLLHPTVSKITQPFEGKFIINGEIYNWKKLANQYNIDAKNDSELVFKLIKKEGFTKAISIIDGPYALAYWNENKVYLATDIIGVKPLWLCENAFASEGKVLKHLFNEEPIQLNPGEIAILDLETGNYEFSKRKSFSIVPEIEESYDEIIKRLKILLKSSIEKRTQEHENNKIGILFSGGTDSGFIALMLKQLNIPFTCYTAAFKDGNFSEAKDLSAAREVADYLNVPLKINQIGLKELPAYTKKTVELIEDTNPIKVSVAIPFFLACEKAKQDGINIIFSGLGAEDVFAGYSRMIGESDINKKCLESLKELYHRDAYRDDVISMYHSIELRVPFLDKELVDYALKIPAKYKIRNNKLKKIYREAAEELGFPKKLAERKRNAAQYGSNFDKALKKLAKKENKLRAEYTKEFLPRYLK